MKLKKLVVLLSSLLASMHLSNAATFFVTNIGAGPGDTLYADSNNVLLGSGFSAIGYFASTVLVADINTIGGLQNQLTLGSFTTVAFANDFTGGGIGDGYVSGSSVNVGNITGADPLIGRSIYVITTNQSSLAAFASGSGTGNQVALVNFGTIQDDDPFPFIYNGNPVAPATVVIGGSGSFIESSGGHLGNGSYSTLTLAIPEPSTLLLSALGVLALLRRKR